MFIVYGRGNFARKIVTQQELGINPPNPDIKYFEFIQEYFHLFWIPFIGTDKGWYVRKKDDKLYHVSPQREAELVRIGGNPKMSLWAYTGSLILIAAMMVVIINMIVVKIEESYSRYLSDKQKEEERDRKWERIQHATLNDYYMLFWDGRKAAKVIAIKGDSLRLSVMRNFFPERPDTADVLTEFAEPAAERDSLWFSKQKLKGMLKGEESKWLEEIMTVTGGELKHYLSVKTEGYGPGYILYKVCTKNSVKILDMNDSLHNIKFSEPFPIILGRGGIALFQVKGDDAESSYRFDLFCEDIAGKKFTYRVNESIKKADHH